MRFFLIILLFISSVSNAEKFYISIIGNSGNSGSFASPWDLATALDHPAAVDPGDTIYILAGTYTGTFISELAGTLVSPIKVIAQGRVIIDGSLVGETIKNIPALRVNGPYTWYIGIEITNSDPDRAILIEGSNPDERRGGALDVFGPGVKIINCILYDTGQGLGAWTPATDSEFYGNVIFNNGWDAPDRLHGHGIYTQNNTGLKTFKDNIVLHNFFYGWHVYSSAGQINNFLFQGNVLFNDGSLIGGESPLNDIELDTNFLYNDVLNLGYISTANDGLILRGNFIPYGMYLFWWQNVTATGNTFFSTRSLYSAAMKIYWAGAPNLSTFDFDNNIYYKGTAPPEYAIVEWHNTVASTGDVYYLDDWQGLGQDAGATIVSYPELVNDFVLNGRKVEVRRNAYDANRTHIIIYNWDLLSTINVNVNGILSEGSTYELRNVLDYFGDVITGTFAGGDSLSVPMTGHTVALPFGYDEVMGPSTFPEFGTFVLINTGEPEVVPVIIGRRVSIQ